MTSPNDQQSPKKSPSDNFTFSRSYTTGGKLGARQMFVFNEDGTIAGLKQVDTANEKGDKSPNSIRSKSGDFPKDKKFGHLSSVMSVSAMSVAETKVAFSDANYLPEEGQQEGARIGNMRGKPGITIWNLLLVPGTLFFSLLSGADFLQSSTQILTNDAYFALEQSQASKIAANSLSYAQGIAIPTVLVIGFIYDLVGRRTTTVVTFLIGASMTFILPLVSPSIIGYDAIRIVFIQTMVVMLSNPFINDYVTVQSRGLATGFQMIGLTVGNLLSIGGLFTLTEALDNKLIAYSIVAAMQVCWAVLTFFMISEPSTMNEKEARHQGKKSFCGKLFSMLKQAYKACKQDPILGVSLIGLIPSRNTANLQQANFYIWIASDKFGLTGEEAASTWQTQNIISNACALPMVFIIGRLSDKVSPKILVPGVLIFQMVIMTGYMFCQDPKGWYAYFLSAFQGGSGFIIIVAMQGYAVKRVPKMIRGIVMALIISLSGLGGILYLQLSKLFFETAPNMVFGLIGMFDAAVLVFILVAISVGKFGDPAPQEDDGAGSKNMNAATADFAEDHKFDDDIPEVPHFRDIYEEHIPEMSSDREASSFHTKRQFLKNSNRSGSKVDDYLRSSHDDSEIIGSIRQTDLHIRTSYNGNIRETSKPVKVSQGDTGRMTRVNYIPPNTLMASAERITLTSGMNEGAGRPRDVSTVNRSDSDEEKEDALRPSNDRQTYVPRRHRKQQKKAKRSSSFEDQSRQTLIQEMISSTPFIREEKEEDSD